MRPRRNQRGSLTLTSEALILVVIGLMCIAAVAFLVQRSQTEMDNSSSWVACPNVLDCPAADQQQKPQKQEQSDAR